MPKVIIGILDIIQYIDGRDRPVKEGEAVFKAGHVILCGVKACNPNVITSLCLQTSALTSPPHEIEITLAEEVKQWQCVCTCKAGNSGFCKHVVATLIYINKNEDLDLVSATDLTQAWGKEKKGIAEVYETTKIQEFWCHKPKKDDWKSHKIINQRNFDRLAACNPSSALFKFMEGRYSIENRCNSVGQELLNILAEANNSSFLTTIAIDVVAFGLKPCCQQIINDLTNSNQLKIANEYSQKSDSWKKERQLRITGSRCYSIFTFAKEDSWEKKSLDYFFPTEFTSKYTTHGTVYENEALNCYKLINQLEVATPGLIICKQFPWLAYSPDGIICINKKPKLLLEIKCPYSGKNVSAEELVNHCDYLVKNGHHVTLKKRHRIFAQIQFGMALLNLCRTHLIIYSPYSKTFINIIVDFDEGFAKTLLETVSSRYLSKMIHVVCKNKQHIQ